MRILSLVFLNVCLWAMAPSFLASAEEGTMGSQPFWQLTLRYDETGLFVLKAAEIAPMRKAVRVPGLAGAAGALAFTVEWLDTGKQVTAVDEALLPVGIHVPLGEGSGCAHVVLPEGVIVTRLRGPLEMPAAVRMRRAAAKGAATDTAWLPKGLAQTDYELPIQHVEALSGKGLVGEGPVGSAKIQDTGTDGNRLVMAVLGDGYTAANLSSGAFTQDAANLVSAFGTAPPWDDLFNATNVYRVDLESNEQGADLEDGQTGTYVDTYLHASFWTNGIERLLALDSTGYGRAYQAVDDHVGPGVWDEIVVLVNSTKYGGSGGAIAVSSINTSSDEVVLHEFGHSFAGLADEYTSPYPDYPAGDGEPNVDFDFARDDLKWNAWVEPATPLPTPDETTYDGVVGAFEGARYLETGIYRPMRVCAMRSLGYDFCVVCQEAHILEFFEPIALVDVVDPVSGSSVEVPPGGATFSVSPISVPGLTYAWELNGAVLPEAVSASLLLSPGDLAGLPEVDSLELIVTYPTDRVRIATIQETYNWSLTGGDAGVQFTEVPVGGWFEEGDPLELRVGVSGTYSAIDYQWRKDGVDLTAETGSVYRVDHVALSNEGWYTVRVTTTEKEEYETEPVFVRVVPTGGLPVAFASLVLSAGAMVVWGVGALTRKRR